MTATATATMAVPSSTQQNDDIAKQANMAVPVEQHRRCRKRRSSSFTGGNGDNGNNDNNDDHDDHQHRTRRQRRRHHASLRQCPQQEAPTVSATIASAEVGAKDSSKSATATIPTATAVPTATTTTTIATSNRTPPSHEHHLTHLFFLLDDIRNHTEATSPGEAIQPLLHDFCKSLHSLPGLHDARHDLLDAVMSDLCAYGGIPIILDVLRHHCDSPHLFEWALAALIWFLYNSPHRAASCLQAGAVPCIADVMRQFHWHQHVHCAALAALSHLLGNAHAGSVPPDLIVAALERFPKCVHIYKHACAAFGAVHVVSRKKQCVARMVTCVYRGVLDHSVWDDEARYIGWSLLRLLLGPAAARRIMLQAEDHLCHGGAA